MFKKNLFFTFITLFFISFGLTSCSSDDKDSEQNYFFSAWRIYESTFQESDWYFDEEYTFAQNKAFYNSFSSSPEAKFLGSGNGDTYNTLFNFFTSKNFTPSEAEELLTKLNSVGNKIVWLYSADGEQYIVMCYFEKY